LILPVKMHIFNCKKQIPSAAGYAPLWRRIQEVNKMEMDIKEEERTAVCHALNVYLKDLRQEISKTENHDMKVDLRHEEDLIAHVIERC